MNTVTLPKNQYAQILNTQKELRGGLIRLQKIVSYIAQDEVSPLYIKKLSKIEKGLSAGKGLKLKNKTAIKAFFKTL